MNQFQQTNHVGMAGDMASPCRGRFNGYKKPVNLQNKISCQKIHYTHERELKIGNFVAVKIAFYNGS